jgi:hypothetical protein
MLHFAPLRSPLLSRGSQVRVLPGVPGENGYGVDACADGSEGEAAAICTSVCTLPDEAVLQAAIDRLTRALATADDDVIAELVAERAALREERRAMREGDAGVVRLDSERARRETKR